MHFLAVKYVDLYYFSSHVFCSKIDFNHIKNDNTIFHVSQLYSIS